MVDVFNLFNAVWPWFIGSVLVLEAAVFIGVWRDEHGKKQEDQVHE